MKKHEIWAEALVSNTHQSSGILLRGLNYPGMPGWAVKKLKSAHEHLYAVMLFEFVRMAESEIICDGVRMDSGEVKTGREFLVDDIVGKMMAMIRAKYGSEADTYVNSIRGKLAKLLEDNPERAVAA